MTESSQQEFFLDHFQKVRELLDGGEVSEALEVMLDVRENGFVNRELDSMIDSLRDDPSDEVISQALDWATMIIDRLTSFGGDVFQLVEEFSEASLGLSEAEWVPVESAATDQQMSPESDDLLAMDFDDLEDLEEVESEDLDIDLEFSDDDEAWDEIDDLEDLSDLDEFSGLDELSDLDELSGLDELSDLGELSDPDEPERDEEIPGGPSRHEQETKPHPSVADEDRETRRHQAVPGDQKSRLNSLRETAKQRSIPERTAEQQAVEEEVKGTVDGFSFDGSEGVEEDSERSDAGARGFVDESTRRSDSLDKILADEADSAALEDAGTSTPEELDQGDSESDAEDDEDDFDFDLGFENPASRIETPSSQSDVVDDATDDAADEDDFDLDFGFENPEARAEMPDMASSPSESEVRDAEDEPEEEEPEEDEQEEDEQEEDFDFDFGFDNPNSRTSTPSGSPFPVSDSDANDSEADRDIDADRGEHRDPEMTPASMPSIPRLRVPADEEETSPHGDAPSANDVGDSLDDDEFFELAESLNGESSEVSSSGPYRGEPLMNTSNTPMPSVTSTPTPVPSEESDLSEVSQGREREDTPNPFAHEAPTGVQRALVDAHSSFTLEEIRDSEVSEAQNEEAAVGALMSEARRLYETGKFESAHDLLGAVLEREAVSDEARELMGTVAGELERQHQAKLGSLSKIPELEVAMSDIPTMNLDHRFGFLLSQIDGMSSFEDILELSSMTRVETLEVLVQMLDRDIIGLD
jgi:hypothetical protein